jgi:P-aminobenzoate N-oxygenase AurF
MTTFDLYTLDPQVSAWDVPAAGAARFTWEYADGRDRLLSLYQRGKDRQWDATTRIDWSIDLDPDDPIGLPRETHPLAGSQTYDRMSEDERRLSGNHLAVWQFSQFLHGEQGALLCSARIVESVPDLDAKYYAATQVMDEARHVETYSRLLQDKVGYLYPINPYLKALLDDTLTESRWDFPYLGMQVLIEGLALAAFGVIRDMTVSPLVKQVLAYVMADEARHVAFGRLALRDYYAELTSSELAEREEFVIEGCHLMRNRFRGEEVWEGLGYDRADCVAAVEASPYMQAFRTLLFSRIVPCVKDIGLWSDRVQKAYADMGVLDLAGLDLDALAAADDEKADEQDRRRRDAERFEAEYAVRRAEVDSAVDAGRAD